MVADRSSEIVALLAKQAVAPREQRVERHTAKLHKFNNCIQFTS